MIKNSDLERGAKKRVFCANVIIVAANTQSTALVDSENDIRITAINFVYSTGTDATACTEAIQVGTAASAALYLTAAPSISQAAGIVQSKTVASTAILPAGTALIVNKAAASGCANVGVVTVNVYYEIIDSTTASRP